jgi:hypothetical protein
MLRGLKIPPTPGLEVRGFCHGERRRESRKKVTVVLAFGHALGAHEALGRPYALPGFLEVVHRFFEDGVFIGQPFSEINLTRQLVVSNPTPRSKRLLCSSLAPSLREVL